MNCSGFLRREATRADDAPDVFDAQFFLKLVIRAVVADVQKNHIGLAIFDL